LSLWNQFLKYVNILYAILGIQIVNVYSVESSIFIWITETKEAACENVGDHLFMQIVWNKVIV